MNVSPRGVGFQTSVCFTFFVHPCVARLRLHRSSLVWSPRTVRAALRLDGHHGSCVPLDCQAMKKWTCPRSIAHCSDWRRKCTTSFLFARRRRRPSIRRHDSALETFLDKAAKALPGPIFASCRRASTRRRRRRAVLLWPSVRLSHRPSRSSLVCPPRPRASSRRARKLHYFAEDDDIRDILTGSSRNLLHQRPRDAQARVQAEQEPSCSRSSTAEPRPGQRQAHLREGVLSRHPDRGLSRVCGFLCALVALSAFLDVGYHVACVGSGTAKLESKIGSCTIYALDKDAGFVKYKTRRQAVGTLHQPTKVVRTTLIMKQILKF